MPEENKPNYPDILGHASGGTRHNIGLVQVSLAVHPRVVRAGRPFEAILLVQNASDVEVDVTTTLKLPDRDAKKQKNRFTSKNKKLVVGLEAVETGYITLPISCLPDTAVSQEYWVGVEVKVKTVGKEKPKRIRLPEGGGKVEIEHLERSAVHNLEKLQNLAFSTSKMARATVQAPFSVMSGKVGAIADLQPGWTSLWTIKDHMDDRLLLQKYHQTLKLEVLPKLNRQTAFQTLLDRTQERFRDAGFSLTDIEAIFVAKLLTLILEYAAPSEGEHGVLAAGEYYILPLLDEERLKDDRPIVLPRWCSKYLRIIARDERAAKYPVQAVSHFLYDELLRDAIKHGFNMIEVSTGENLGEEDEMATYADQVIQMFQGSDVKLDFTHAYMPLILGGIIVYDRVLLADEKLGELIQGMRTIMDERSSERNENTEPIFSIAARIIDQALMKYGYRNR